MPESTKGIKNFIKRFLGDPVDATKYFETLMQKSPISLHENREYKDEFAMGEYLQHIQGNWDGASEIYERL